MKNDFNIIIECPSFKDNTYMPIKHTGFGVNSSPAFHIYHISDKAVSIAIVMDDLDIPFIRAYNHWLIWNIPKMDEIPESIPNGAMVKQLGNAVQGLGYGKHEYKGPHQPVFIRNTHRYIFRFYILDCFLRLDSTAKKKDLLEAMEGHILQQANITGKYKR